MTTSVANFRCLCKTNIRGGVNVSVVGEKARKRTEQMFLENCL